MPSGTDPQPHSSLPGTGPGRPPGPGDAAGSGRAPGTAPGASRAARPAPGGERAGAPGRTCGAGRPTGPDRAPGTGGSAGKGTGPAVRLLLVEEDDGIAVPLAEGLRRYGYTVERAATGATALAARTGDLVLLDPGLPDMDGLDVCRALRARSTVPIVLIGTLDQETDRDAGLAVGADDYLVKPFGVRELVARLRAVTRRTQGARPPAHGGTAVPAIGTGVRRIGPLTVDRHAGRATLDGRPLALTRAEFGVLACLAADPGSVWFRRQITDEVWGPDFFGPAGTLDVHVAALRRTLGDPGWITAVHRAAGYRLTVPARRERAGGAGR